MAKYRYVNTKFWIDNYISELDPLEKYFFLYLLTNPQTDISGIYELPMKTIISQTDLKKDDILDILKRFEKDEKVIYEGGWIALINFIKHQSRSPLIKKGIENGINKAPKKFLDKVSILYKDSLNNLNLNLNYNLNIKDEKKTSHNKKLLVKNTPFSLKEEIKKLEDSPRRELNIIALYLEYRKPDLQNYEQYSIALKRHMRAAKLLVSFTDDQIIKAINYAKKEFEDIYTLETLMKILTK